VIFSYFVGNISFARIFSRRKNGDITKSGSGNPGSMNMLRTYGVKSGFATLICDTIKGVIPSLTGMLLFRYTGLNEDIGLFTAGVSVIVGHMLPVVYKFKGGKGVACALGVFMVANPLCLIVAFLIGFIYLWFFDYGAVASLFIVAFVSIVQGWQYNKTYADDPATLLVVNLLIFAIFSLIWFAHRSNIVRLLLGKENKANLQQSFRKKLSTQQKEEVKNEYLEEKSELKAEFKKLKAEYKKDVKEKKKSLKSQYKNIKKSLRQSSADLLATELENKKPHYEQLSFDLDELTEKKDNEKK
jgi:glycerol-3-phosphate acyltransferase PlsY